MMRIVWALVLAGSVSAHAASFVMSNGNEPTTNGAIVYGMGTFDTTVAGGRGDIAVPVPKAVALGPMHCAFSIGTGGAASTYTVRVLRSTDNSATFAALSPNITCTTVANTGRSCNYTGTTVPVAAGDTLIFEWSCTGTGTCPNTTDASCVLVAQ